MLAIIFVLASNNDLLLHPKGIVAQSELELMMTNILLMLSIILPTYLLLFVVVYRYCIKKEEAKYDPDHTFGPLGELLMWGLPSVIVVVMAIVTWNARIN